MRRPNRVSQPWRCAHHQPPVAYFPPAKPLYLRGSLSTSHLFDSTRPGRRILGRLRLHTSCTTAVSSRQTTCLLFLPAGGSSRQNQEKIGRSIQAVFKVISAPARFWDRGARCFIWRFMLGLGETAAFFEGPTLRDSTPYVYR